MTNIIAALIITTNTHWVVVKTEPSNINCNVIGCKADHSEMRTEAQTVYRVTESEFRWQGEKKRVVLKSEEIPQAKPVLRVQYSGFDYTIPPSPFRFMTNN